MKAKIAHIVLIFLQKFIINRPYDRLIDADYMERWHVIPRNKLTNLYFHHFFGSDAPVPHDHPWWSVSIILQGQYTEHTPQGTFIRKAGSVTFRKATGLHWIQIDEPVFTLFLTGRNVRSWGFQCDSGWIHWKKYISMRGPERRANGCGD